MFLTPQGEPFFAGTYFPKDDRFGQPPFKRVLHGSCAHLSRAARAGRQHHATRVQEKYAQSLGPRYARAARCQPCSTMRRSRIGAPFRHFLRRLHRRAEISAVRPRRAVVARLSAHRRRAIQPAGARPRCDNMLLGGIYDHVGGGLHRYATDERWLVPHFEKMLYDNAQLIEMLHAGLAAQPHAAVSRARGRNDRLAVARDDGGAGVSPPASMPIPKAKRANITSGPKPEIDAALAGTFAQKIQERLQRAAAKAIGKARTFCTASARNAAFPLSEADEAMLQAAARIAARRARRSACRRCATTRCWPTGTA